MEPEAKLMREYFLLLLNKRREQLQLTFTPLSR